MKQFVSKIWNSPSARNVGKLLSANIFAQALGLLVYPILTRMYSPEDFGLLNLFTSITGVMVLVTTAEYQYAIVLPKEESKARSLVHLCLLILLVVTGAIILSIPFANPIANLFKAPGLAHYWYLLPFSVFGLGLWNILNYWYIRKSAFTRVSGYQITQSTFSVVGKISFGILGWLRGGMIFATVLSPLLSLLFSVGLAWKQYLKELRGIDIQQIKSVAREFANFPKFNLPHSLVNIVGVSLPVWMLTPHFGLEEIGRLSLAMMAAFVPLNILARACYQVLFQRVSELVQLHQPIKNLLRRFVCWMGVFIMVGLTVVYIFLPQMVTILFGAEWIESAAIIKALYPYLLFTPLCGSICFLSDVFAKQKIAMWLEIGYVACLAITLSVGIYTGNFITAIRFFAWTGFAYLSIQFIWLLSLARHYEREHRLI